MSDSTLIRWAAIYDLGTWLMTLGREPRLRARMLAPARLMSGESVLDVGCGTGTLALLAKRQVGRDALVAGIDASAEMVARAARKAGKARLPARFEQASADRLPFANDQFDAVLCTATMHHLPRGMRVDAVREMRRVLKPGGRVLLVDFVFGKRHTIASILHHQHGLERNALKLLVQEAGLRLVDQGPVGMWDLQYVVGMRQESDGLA
jgi:ubiquinone/menaquinone biosynthesis C-methylase UbiE